MATYAAVFEKVSTRPITVATAGSDRLVVAYSGGEIELFGLVGRGLESLCRTTLDQDVACLSMHINDKDDMDVEGCGSVLAVGLWTDSSVRLFALDSLTELARDSTKSEGDARLSTQARDILVVRLGGSSHTHVVVGLGDGTLLIFEVNTDSKATVLSVVKKVLLGSRPISLTAFTSAGNTCIFASCDRPTVIYCHNNKIAFSVVNWSEVSYMAPFHCELFPESMALISSNGLTIASVEDIKNIHVQSYPLNESPNRIAYSKVSSIFVGNYIVLFYS
jgi:DNA damage-binding protein 1